MVIWYDGGEAAFGRERIGRREVRRIGGPGLRERTKTRAWQV